jgi:pilus assembly protein Flp/PilA
VLMFVDQTIEFLKDEGGSAGMEYALLVSLIAVAIVAGITAFGTALSAYYDDLVTRMPSGS